MLKANFENIYVYPGHDVLIVPLDGRKYSYSVQDENVVKITGNKIVYLSDGETRVEARLNGDVYSFNVFSRKNFRFENDMLKVKERIISDKANERHPTVFMGDSFFQFWRDGTNGVTLFKDDFKGKDFFNIGVSATTTHDWRTSLEDTLYLINPKAIVLNIGINNVDDLHENGDELILSLLTLLTQIHNHYPNLIIYYISITRCTNDFSKNWEKHRKSNEFFRNYASEHSFLRFLDLNYLYNDENAALQADGLHPNNMGYRRFKELIDKNVD